MAPGREEDAKEQIKILKKKETNHHSKCGLGCGKQVPLAHTNCVECTVNKTFEEGGHAITNHTDANKVRWCNFTSHDGRQTSIKVADIQHKSHLGNSNFITFPAELRVNPENLNEDDFLSMLIEFPQYLTKIQEYKRSEYNNTVIRRAFEFRQSQEATHKLYVLNQGEDDNVSVRDRALMNPAPPNGMGDFRQFKHLEGVHITHFTCVNPDDIDNDSLTGNKFLGPPQWSMIPHLTPGQEFNQDSKTWGSAGGIAGCVKFFFTHYSGIYHWYPGAMYYAYYVFGLNPSYANYHQLAINNGVVSDRHKLLCYHTCDETVRVEYDMCVKIEIQDGNTIETCKLTIVRCREEDTDSPRTARTLQPLMKVEIEIPMSDEEEDPNGVYANIDGVFLVKPSTG